MDDFARWFFISFARPPFSRTQFLFNLLSCYTIRLKFHARFTCFAWLGLFVFLFFISTNLKKALIRFISSNYTHFASKSIFMDFCVSIGLMVVLQRQQQVRCHTRCMHAVKQQPAEFEEMHFRPGAVVAARVFLFDCTFSL